MSLPGQALSQPKALITVYNYVFIVDFLDCLLPRTVINVRAGSLSVWVYHYVPVPAQGWAQVCTSWVLALLTPLCSPILLLGSTVPPAPRPPPLPSSNAQSPFHSSPCSVPVLTSKAQSHPAIHTTTFQFLSSDFRREERIALELQKQLQGLLAMRLHFSDPPPTLVP